MPLFYFLLKDGQHCIPDRDGQELADEAEALRFAETIARDLMKHREINTRFWRIQICDDYMRPLTEVTFASADETIGHLSAEMHNSIDTMCRRAGALSDSIAGLRSTFGELKSTLAQARTLLTNITN